MSRPYVKVSRSRLRPKSWLELNFFADESAYRRGIEPVNGDPERDAVWRELASALREPHVESESFEEVAPFP